MDKKIRVLIVEDSADDAFLLERELKRGGYEATCERVETVEAMREALEKKEWDLVLADYRPPNFSAPDALKLMQSRGLDLPFIIVSGAVSEEMAVEALKAGAHDFISKGKLARLVPSIEREIRAAGVRRDSKRAEEALHESLQRLEFALQGAELGIWDWNPQDGAVVFSDIWAQMLEYRPDEVEPTVEFFKQLVHPEDLAAVLDRLTGHVEGRLPVYESEHRLRTKSGRFLWVMDRGRIVERDRDGSPVRVTGIIADITARKRAAEQLKFQADIIDNSPVSAAYHDRELNTIWINKAYQKATGLSLEEVRGKKCYEVWNLSKPCRGCPVVTAIETGVQASYELTPDNQDHWPETQGYWLSVAAPVRNEKGEVVGAIEFAVDITERKKAEEMQRKKADETNLLNKIMLTREMRVVEVKQEVNALLEELGRPAKYTV